MTFSLNSDNWHNLMSHVIIPTIFGINYSEWDVENTN